MATASGSGALSLPSTGPGIPSSPPPTPTQKIKTCDLLSKAPRILKNIKKTLRDLKHEFEQGEDGVACRLYIEDFDVQSLEKDLRGVEELTSGLSRVVGDHVQRHIALKEEQDRLTWEYRKRDGNSVMIRHNFEKPPTKDPDSGYGEPRGDSQPISAANNTNDSPESTTLGHTGMSEIHLITNLSLDNLPAMQIPLSPSDNGDSSVHGDSCDA